MPERPVEPLTEVAWNKGLEMSEVAPGKSGCRNRMPGKRECSFVVDVGLGELRFGKGPREGGGNPEDKQGYRPNCGEPDSGDECDAHDGWLW